jgi:radical SAM superfamily enzyme YgiQ (UPF0313 family)
MPHVAFVPFTGLRICRPELLELGFSLPGLRRRGAALAELPALGLLTLAGMLPDDWTCSYHPATDGASESLLETLLAERPTMVAISALTASVESAYVLASGLRAAGVQVVMGGLHVSACEAEAKQFCDAVVVGAGESTWRDVLADAEAGELRSLYRATRSEHIWPQPRYDLLGGDPPRFTLQTQRGCPFACDFCAASRLLGPFREKPLAHIVAELATLSRISPRPVIELADDNTFAGKRDAGSLCDALAASGARWFTECDWRIGERPELLARLAASGCVQILIGIESLVFRYPGMGIKQAELARIMDALTAIQEAGVAVNGCFIVGADGETRASIDRLVQFVLDSPLAEVQLTLQTPFPGTELRRRLATAGRLLPDRGWSHYTLLDLTFQPDCLTVAELERGFQDAIREIYSAAPTLARNEIRRDVWRRNRALRGLKSQEAL